MIHTYTLFAILLGPLFLSPFPLSLATYLAKSPHSVSQSRYSEAHSLGDHYVFDPRDGWQSANVTNLQYKYPRDTDLRVNNQDLSLKKRKVSKLKEQNRHSLSGTVTKLVNDAIDGLKAIGKPQTVKITWYTGHDLQNPSCWSNVNWAPTVRLSAHHVYNLPHNSVSGPKFRFCSD